jgi:WD40 repeat protein
MITRVFQTMDVDGDGLLSTSDIKAYFLSIGRPSTDAVIRKWIRDRDVDQDGVVSLEEYVASYAYQLDPLSRPTSSSTNPTISSIATAFGTLRLACSPLELNAAVNAASQYVQRILDSPSTKEFWKVSILESEFQNAIGHIFGGLKLMLALGFVVEDNGQFLALNNQGPPWDSVPLEIRKTLSRALDELQFHNSSLFEPSVSNIAAVSSAIAQYGETPVKAQNWVVALETVINILANILNHPTDLKYFTINPANPNFHRRVGALPGGIEMLIALGFREEEGGVLVLPLSSSLYDVAARKLELEVGLDRLRKKIATDSPPPQETKATNLDPPKSKPDRVLQTKKISSDDQKALSELKAEKMKRQKAETSMYQQSQLIKELQQVVSTLQQKEHKRLTLRQGLTLARMDTKEKEAIEPEVKALGKSNFGFEKSRTSGNRPRTSSAPPSRQPARPPSNNVSASTTLSSCANIGDTRLDTLSHESFKVGMKVLIGSGTTAEIRTVVGLGSLILDLPLQHQHPLGAPVFGLPSTDKNLRILESRLMKEFCRGIVVEHIIPQVIAEGGVADGTLHLNELYGKRVVHMHHIVLYPMNYCLFGEQGSIPISISNQTGNLLYSRQEGICALDHSIDFIGILNIFHKLSDTNESISLQNFSQHLELNASYFHFFLNLAHASSIKSPLELFHFYCDESSHLISWNAYFKMIHTDLILASPQNSRRISESNISDQLRIMFCRIFDLVDTDTDELLTIDELSRVFGGLDGISPLLADLSKCFPYSIDSDHPKPIIDFQTFVSVRIQYCRLKTTLLGGVFLEGRRTIENYYSDCCDEENSLLDIRRLVSSLPQAVLDAVHLRQGKRLEELLGTVPTSTINDLESALYGESFLSQEFSSMPSSNLLLEAQSANIIQAVFDSSGKRVFAFSDTGVVHVIDIFTNRLLFKQRVIWSESLQSRPIESGSKFYEWLENYSDAQLRNEIEPVSAHMAKFFCSEPLLASPMAIDADGGLLVVNCSLTKSVCILDELSLRRIYRIRVPLKIPPSLEEKIQKILQDRSPILQISPEECTGLISQLKICARKSLLICQIIRSPEVHCLSLQTGEILCTLFGHSRPVSVVMAPSTSIPYLMTGSEDATVRLWTLHDLPQVFNSLSKSEARIVKSGKQSKSLLRVVSSDLATLLCLEPTWRRAIVIAFNDGKEIFQEARPNHLPFEVEVVFEDASSKCYANRSLLRDPCEALMAPNGPPIWGNSDLQFTIGATVIAFEIDPEVATLTCARLLGVSSNLLLPYSEWISKINSLSNEIQFDVAAFLQAGVCVTQIASLSSLMRLVFDPSHALLPTNPLYQKCDRILAGGHSAAIVGLHYSQNSKLLFSIDSIGWCCVWDLCGNRTSLSLTAPLIIGTPPFSLSARLHLNDCLTSTSPEYDLKVVSICSVSFPKGVIPPYPLTSTQLTAAYRLDCKFPESDVRCRGFIYVKKDLSFVCVSTSAFLPALVTFDSPDHFLATKLLDANLSVSTPAQKIFTMRSSLLRIIYSVSCSHTSLESLAGDLSTYGILQRGYSKTPSERLELVCFENFLSLHPEMPRGERSKSKDPLSSQSGIILEIQFPDLIVAIDCSNEILRVRQSDVQLIYNRQSSSRERFSVGSKVLVRRETPRNLENCLDNIVLIQVERSSGGQVFQSGVISLGLGRCTFPTTARQMTHALISDSIARQVRTSFLRQQESTICALLNNFRIQKIRRSSWTTSHSQLATHLFRPGAQEGLSSLTDLGGESSLPLAGLCSADIYNLFVKYLGLALAFSQTNKMDPSHPLTQYLALVLHVEVSDLNRLTPERASRAYSQYLLRNDTTADELFATVYELASKEWNFPLKPHHLFLHDFPQSLTRKDLLNFMNSSVGRSARPKNLASAMESTQFLSPSFSCRRESLLANRGLSNFLLHQHYFLEMIRKIRDKVLKYRVEMFVLVKTTIILDLQTKSHILREDIGKAVLEIDLPFVSNSAVPAPGQYSPTSIQKYLEHFIPALILTAESLRQDTESHISLFVWDPTPESYGTVNLESARLALRLYERRMTDLMTRMVSPQFLVPLAKGINFGSSLHLESGLNPTLLEWNDKWITLDHLLRNIGRPLFHVQYLSLFRYLVCDLMMCVNQIHESGFLLRSLSLSSIYMDSTEDWTQFGANTPKASIKILCSPTLCERGSKQRDSIDGTMYQSYLNWQPHHSRSHQFGAEWMEAVDLFDLAECLFILAFGAPLPTIELSKNSTESSLSSHLVAHLLSYLLSANPSQTLASESIDDGGIFSLITICDLLSGRNSSKLKTFWKMMRTQGLSGESVQTGGFFESGIVVVWEKCILQVANSVRVMSERAKIRNVICASLSQLTMDSLRELFFDLFHLRLTSQELHLVVLSLYRCSTEGGARSQRTTEEMINPALQYFLDLFDDIIFFECFQETIFLITHCLLSGTQQQGVALPILRRLSLFQQLDLSEKDTLIPQLIPHLSGFVSSPVEFLEDMFVSPLQQCLGEILNLKKVDLNTVVIQNHLVMISSCLNCIEELLFVRTVGVNALAHKKKAPITELEKLSNLAETGVDLRWIFEDAHRPILDLLLDSSVIPAIVLYVTRFLTLDIARKELPQVSLKYSSKKAPAVELSIGSKLVVRLVKFFEHCILCLGSLSRLLKNYPVPLDPILDTAQRHNEVQDYLVERSFLQKFTSSTISLLMMISMGEEVPYSLGCREVTLTATYGPLLRPTGAPQLSKTHWNTDLSKMFEPLLRDLIGEDGKGNTSKSSSATDSLTTAANIASVAILGFGNYR